MDNKEYILIGLILLMLVAAVYFYPKVPSRIPTHWGPSGEADAFGPRWHLFIIPLTTLGIYGLFHVIPKIAVYKLNIQKFLGYFYAFKLIFVLFMLVIYAGTIIQIHKPFNMSALMLPMVAVMFIGMGQIMPKMKRNFFIGIRTPWTLSSDVVWEKTHKLGGKLFQVMGGLMLLTLFFPKNFFWLFMVPLFSFIAFIFAYSYWEYRKESTVQ